MIAEIKYNRKNLHSYFSFFLFYAINISFAYVYPYIPVFLIIPILFLVSLFSAIKSNNGLYLYLILLYILLVLSSFYGDNIDYGLFKSTMGLLLPMSLVAILNALNYNNKKIYLLSFSHFVILLNIFTIIYKIKVGFWDRTTGFALLGPITFGWLNLYFFAVLLTRSKLNLYLLFFSFIMIIWSGSKGPFLVCMILLIYNLRTKVKFNFKNSIYLLLLFLPLIYFFYVNYEDYRIIKAFVDLSTNTDYITTQGAGSIGSRLDYYIEALNIIKNNFIFGIGFGNWENIILGHRYPHNILLEIGAESGFIILLLFLSILFFNNKNKYLFILLIGFSCQLVSGDFSYVRYYLFFYLIGSFIQEPIKYDDTLHTPIL